MVSVRPMRRADAKDVARLMVALGAYHVDRLQAKPEDFLRYCLGAKRQYRVWVAVEGKQCVGFVLSFDRFSFVRKMSVRTVDLLYVDAAARRHGVGRLLMLAAAADAVAQKIKRFVVTAAPDNKVANRFYGKIGMAGEKKTAARYVLSDQSLRQFAKS